MTPELTNNLQAIAARFPEVFEELKGQVYTQPSVEAVAHFLDTVYGRQDRDKVFKRWIRLCPQASFHVVVTTGLGDGSHLTQLLDHLPTSTRLCVIEADTSMLLGVLQNKDIASLLNDPRLILLTPFCYREIIQRLNLELIGVDSAAQFIYTPIFETNSGLYRNMMDTVMRQLTIRWNQLKTDITNADAVFSNTIKNLATHQLGSEISALQNLFKDRPFILVGAGPSLDDSIEFLKAAQNKAIIAVVNSAYRAVVNKGILPDITVAVDPYEGTLRGYEKSDTSHPILISTYLVFPEVPKRFKDKVFPLSSYNFLMTVLRKVLNLPEESNIVGDGTVSSTVVNLAAYMGCNQVYLVGQDMAVKTDGQIHTKDSFYTDDNQNSVDTEKCQWLPGNHGELVPVEEKLHAYHRIFENQVSHYTDIQFFNLAKTGAKIHGAPYIELDIAIERIREYPPHPYHTLLSERVKAAKVPESMADAARFFFQKYQQFLETLLPTLMRFAVKVEIATHETPTGSPWSKTSEQQRDQILNLMQQNPLFTMLLSEGRTKKEYHDFIRNEEPWKLITDDSATPEELLPQVWALVEGSLFQKQVIDDYLLKHSNPF